MNNSKIEWTDKTWNPVTGCTKVSQGCKNCYAEKMYERFNGKGSFKQVICHDNRLGIPYKWKKPSMIFVNSMSDLFHEQVPFFFIDAVFSVMADAKWHTYQVLTKRPERMLEFYNWKYNQLGYKWKPSGNIWIGVSVENQQAADERISFLLSCEATIHFLSCEPLLGEINFNSSILKNIDWIIAGGESGPNARPMHPDWIRSIRDQCKNAEVAFFFKQWGEYYPAHDLQCIQFPGKQWINFDPETSMCRVGKKMAGRKLDGKYYDEYPANFLKNE